MITLLENTIIRRGLCHFSAVLMLTLGVPMNLFAYDPNRPVEVEKEVIGKVESRLLSFAEMDELTGRNGGNPYYAGQSKFDESHKGVNLRTGNFSISATDLSFEGGYGVPVNVTRSYSVNSLDEGPFGIGWTLSADLRSTAGGLLKSSKAPVRSVPVGMRRRPNTEVDPNIAAQPVEAVIVTDADGKETTIQRDVDGILTTPPWDKNEYETEYEYVEFGTGIYWILKSNKTMTPDGSIYQYSKHGSYPNGSKPWNDQAVAAEPNNVLKPDWVEDRQGNKTNYLYGSTQVTFTKANGVVNEDPLVQVSMPNGRTIDFNWTGNRITNVRVWSTGTTNEFNVNYAYTNGALTMVTTPGGKKTRYGYSGTLLNSITDQRGFVTNINYNVSQADSKVSVAEIIDPNGIRTLFNYSPGQGSYKTTDNVGNRSAELPHGGFTFNQLPNGAIETVYGVGQYFMNLPTTEVHKTFLPFSYDLSTTETWVYGPTLGFGGLDPWVKINRQTKSYNFLGNPLKEINEEFSHTNPNQVVRTTTTETAFWGESKYFQERAKKVSASGLTPRYSFTDYYDDQAAAGSRGQTKRVYDNKHRNLTGIYPGSTVPAYAQNTPSEWKYKLGPVDLNKYSAQFEYDSKGRPVKVWKLQKVTNGTYQYVQTDSVYGSDSYPAYGNATQVTEDAGVGKINRVTKTLEFDLMGRAVHTENGAGQQFRTNYDGDGQVQSVEKLSASVWTPVITYTYGATDLTVENGQPLSIVDGLSGSAQTISYVQTGIAKGSPLVVSEDDGGTQQSSSTYSYTDLGDRDTVTIATPNGTTRYKYYGYQILGTPGNQNRVFSKINKQTLTAGNWVNSNEEVRYGFDVLGRMKTAKFGLTPQNLETNYDSFEPASYAAAEYLYDFGGRILSVEHNAYQLQGQSYVKAAAILATSAEYNNPLGLKTATKFYNPVGTGFSLQRTESYGYDQDFDYLTSVNYGDGSAVQTWEYDAAGNRSSASANTGAWSYDNLNRMTASPGVTYDHDSLGNRQGKHVSATSQTSVYGWDAVNRMTSLSVSGVATSYAYRADGMRVKKTKGADVTRSYYDGQMPVEEDSVVSGTSSVTRNFVGARGIESIFTTTTSGTTTAFPLYDCHGNMVATVARSGAGFVTSNVRTYDVWGGVRTGATTGGPKGRYVANLGHVQDDESGLIYMRARYYEPESGRFISEDPARELNNWYLYVNNNPISFTDPSGKFLSAVALLITGLILALFTVVAAYVAQFSPDPIIRSFCTFLGSVAGALALAVSALGISDAVVGSPLAPLAIYLAAGAVIMSTALAFLAYHQIQIYLELISDEGWDGQIIKDNGLNQSAGKFGGGLFLD